MKLKITAFRVENQFKGHILYVITTFVPAKKMSLVILLTVIEKVCLMKHIKIFTIGVYGNSSDSFFNMLVGYNIDTFCDIRNRRAVRGSEYSFVNSKRLQARLTELGIKYLHIPELSTPDAIRKIQYEADKKLGTTQRKRETLSEPFISAYKKEILKYFDFKSFLNELETINASRVVLFCVEKSPFACHRSIVSDYFRKKYKFPVKHL